jgi:cathepsin A (carboxypeptidase C)
MESSFAAEFRAAKSIPWVVEETGKVGGEVRFAGGAGFSAGNITFVNVYEAGYVCHRLCH